MKNKSNIIPSRIIGWFCLLAVMAIVHPVVAQQQLADSLSRDFITPPESAKPRVWWHWMNGNVTKEGITADLEWMKRVGIGGFQMFDGNMGTPRFVDNRLVWMTPEWKDALRHAASEADRLGLEMSMAASGGWSETGGPWVTPKEAMKKVVWSETEVIGPQVYSGKLPSPPTNPGTFQDLARPPDYEYPPQEGLPGAKPLPPLERTPVEEDYYAGIKVLAYRVPEGDMFPRGANPKNTSSLPGANLQLLTDGKLATDVSFTFKGAVTEHWIEFEYDRPWPIQTFNIAVGNQGSLSAEIPRGRLEASQDGVDWARVLTLRGDETDVFGSQVRSYSFPKISAKYFRLVLEKPGPAPFASLENTSSEACIKLAEVELSSRPQINRWQDKAQFGPMNDFGKAVETPAVPESMVTKLADVIDLTAKMNPDGTLNWTVPAGRWKILRLGYSTTGQKNAPASPEATGLEVDKLSSQHVVSYFKTYTSLVRDAIGPTYGKSFRYFLMDSWEAGMENWTDDMLSEFKLRRGYDPTPWLPTLTGAIVESADLSERFLWDFRRTIADLLAENHYGQATRYLKGQRIGLYAEAMGPYLPTTGDGLQLKGKVSVPMGEFWTLSKGQSLEKTGIGGFKFRVYVADLREAASAAHIYGGTLVAAESFTTWPQSFDPNLPAWGQSPYHLKPTGDQALALGVNRIVFHTSDQQPFVDEAHKPGMTLGPFGQHYTRNITWAEQAKAWNTYLARSSYLLQQGRFVADFAYYYGEGAPIAVPFWKEIHPAAPAGYSFDWMNTDILLQARVEDGHIALPGGMSYRLLVLPEDVNRLTLPVVKKLRELIAAGAAVVAPRPGLSPSLTDYPVGDDEIRVIAQEVWGAIDGQDVTENSYGNGKVYWGKSIAGVLESLGIDPDLQYNRPEIGTELVWIHRRTDDTDIYFAASRNEWSQDIKVRFRVEGKEAELWHPDTGRIEPASYKIADGHTTVPLHLDPYGSMFVVFRNNAIATERTLPNPVVKERMIVDGSWQVRFPPDWGAPSESTFDQLISWTESPDKGVKYFSGSATYEKEINIPAEWLKGEDRVVLDLGQVKEMAELVVNGQPVEGVLWKPPYKADLTQFLRPGANQLEVRVTNLWPNRMIGDLQPGTTKTYTWTDFRPFTKDSPLLPSGLLGPVNLTMVREQ